MQTASPKPLALPSYHLVCRQAVSHRDRRMACEKGLGRFHPLYPGTSKSLARIATSICQSADQQMS